MTARRPATLPDIADDDFRRRLSPLEEAIVPRRAADRPEAGGGEGGPAPSPGRPEHRTVGVPEHPGPAASPAQAAPSDLAGRIAAVTHAAALRAARGPKKGVEFLLPERVVAALRRAAAQDGTSMTVKVLEALRDAGYPVTDHDFVDLRKLPKR